MKLLTVPISKVRGWDKNPRGITKEDFERLKKQIKKLGVFKPLVAFEEKGGYTVLGGNMRLRAYRELKHKTVDMVVVDAKSEARKIEINLSDNDRAGYYEDQALAELVLPELKHLDPTAFKVDLGIPWIDLNRVLNRFAPDPEKDGAWEGMPEFSQEDKAGVRSVIVHFKDHEAVKKFFRLMKQKDTGKTKFIWFPAEERAQEIGVAGFKDES